MYKENGNFKIDELKRELERHPKMDGLEGETRTLLEQSV